MDAAACEPGGRRDVAVALAPRTQPQTALTRRCRLVVDECGAQHPVTGRIDGEAEQDREQRLDEDLADDEQAHVGIHAEHQLDGCKGGGGQQGEATRQQRRNAQSLELEPLAVAPGEVTDRKQDERGDAERLKQDRIEQEAGREAGYRADHGAAEQAHGDDHDRHQVWRRAENREVGEERALQDHRGDHDERDPQGDLGVTIIRAPRGGLGRR